MKRILVSYDPSNRIEPIAITGDKLELDGDGSIKITAGDQLVAHLKNYAWVAFEENRLTTRVVDIRGAN